MGRWAAAPRMESPAAAPQSGSPVWPTLRPLRVRCLQHLDPAGDADAMRARESAPGQDHHPLSRGEIVERQRVRCHPGATGIGGVIAADSVDGSIASAALVRRRHEDRAMARAERPTRVRDVQLARERIKGGVVPGVATPAGGRHTRGDALTIFLDERRLLRTETSIDRRRFRPSHYGVPRPARAAAVAYAPSAPAALACARVPGARRATAARVLAAAFRPRRAAGAAPPRTAARQRRGAAAPPGAGGAPQPRRGWGPVGWQRRRLAGRRFRAAATPGRAIGRKARKTVASAAFGGVASRSPAGRARWSSGSSTRRRPGWSS